MLVDGQQQWVTFDEWRYDDETSPPVKAALEASGATTITKVGSANAQRRLLETEKEIRGEP